MENPAYNPEEGQRMANECLAARLLSGKDNAGSGGGGGTGTTVSTIYDPRTYGTTTSIVATPTPVTFQPTRQQPGKRCTCWQPPSDIPHLHKCNSPPRAMCHTNMVVLYTFLFFTALICLATSVLLYVTRIQGKRKCTRREHARVPQPCPNRGVKRICLVLSLDPSLNNWTVSK